MRSVLTIPDLLLSLTLILPTSNFFFFILAINPLASATSLTNPVQLLHVSIRGDTWIADKGNWIAEGVELRVFWESGLMMWPHLVTAPHGEDSEPDFGRWVGPNSTTWLNGIADFDGGLSATKSQRLFSATNSHTSLLCLATLVVYILILCK